MKCVKLPREFLDPVLAQASARDCAGELLTQLGIALLGSGGGAFAAPDRGVAPGLHAGVGFPEPSYLLDILQNLRCRLTLGDARAGPVASGIVRQIACRRCRWLLPIRSCHRCEIENVTYLQRALSDRTAPFADRLYGKGAPAEGANHLLPARPRCVWRSRPRLRA